MSVWGLTASLALVTFYLLRRQQQQQQTATTCSKCAARTDSAAGTAAAASSTPAAKAAASRARPTYKGQKLKMVLVVRNDLQMGKGKMMAQVGLQRFAHDACRADGAGTLSSSDGKHPSQAD
jgi:hypothetical protein